MKFPVNQPIIDGDEKEFLLRCIEDGWISSDGPYVKEFEEKFSSKIGVPYGVAVMNGTAALEAAIFSLNIGVNDEIIMPSFTIISCAIAAIRFGAVPIFVDIEPETWNIDITKIESRITNKTKAIMAVHMYGHPCDMDPIIELAQKYNLYIIEDASQVHGAKYKGKMCGSIGDVATFSFYANKIITTGEGGMVLTKNLEIAERAKSFRNLCFRPEKRFLHTELGDNLRMTNLQAAIGVAQTKRLDEFVKIKRTNGEFYKKHLSTIPGVKIQVEKPWAHMVYWMYCVELEDSVNVDAQYVMNELAAKNIGTRPFFIGLHEQPALEFIKKNDSENFPITERASKRGFYLPSGCNLNESDIIYIANQLRQILSVNRN